MTDNRVKVLIVDDHKLIRSGIRLLLEQEPDFTVVGDTGDGHAAIAMLDSTEPDILLLDISMPSMNGLEVASEVKKKYPNCKMVMLTMHESEEYFFRSLTAGASGYVVKGADPQELLTALRSVHAGGIYLDPSLTKSLVTDYLLNKSTGSYDGLTAREAEVLRLIADGLSNKEIAEELVISVTTVQTHRAHIMEKLDLHNQTELVKYAIRKGILSNI